MTETRVRAGGACPADGENAAGADAAVARFLNEFKGFQSEIKTRMQQQEERVTMLDRKTTGFARPALSAAAEIEVPHRKAFDAYLRNGDDDGLRGLVLEGKGLNTQVAAEGGYLVDPQTADTIRSVLTSTASLRAIANVVQVEATSFDVLVDHGDVGSGWASETAAVAETDGPQIERISIALHELSAMPKASQRLLDDSAFDIEGWLAGRIADKFARAEAAAFVAGDGADKPRGFLDHAKVADNAWEWGKLGYVVTGAAGEFATV
ncbi:MAG: phage major capsid protein, partial [Gemmobacter sp.]